MKKFKFDSILDDIERKPKTNKTADSEEVGQERPFRNKVDGIHKIIQTEDDVVESEITFPNTKQGKRFKKIKSFLNKQ